MTQQEGQKIIDRAVSQLREHFDTVQILVTWQEQGETFGGGCGIGNFYARLQSAQEFIERDKARVHYSQMPDTPPEDGEDWKQPK